MAQAWGPMNGAVGTSTQVILYGLVRTVCTGYKAHRVWSYRCWTQGRRAKERGYSLGARSCWMRDRSCMEA